MAANLDGSEGSLVYVLSMKQLRILCFIFWCLFGLARAHAVSFDLEARARSRPQSLNLIGLVSSDHTLWGDSSHPEENPLYGYWSFGSRFGGSPTLAAFARIAPVAPVVIEIERSMTQRFSKTPNYPCDSLECKGRIDRTDISVQLAAAYKEFLFLGSYLWRDLQTMSANTEVFVELEDLLVKPGNHRYQEVNLFAGKKLDENQTVGVLYSRGEIGTENRAFESEYAVYRTRWRDYTVNAGLGQFRSDYEPLNGFSAILSVGRRWGDSLRLF